MAVVSAVTKFLDQAKVHDIVIELARSVAADSSNIPDLCDLLAQVDVKTLDEVTDIVSAHTDEIIDTVHTGEQINDLIQLVVTLPKLYTHSINRINGLLVLHVKVSLHKFIPGIKESVEDLLSGSTAPGKTLDLSHVTYLLNLLEAIFTKADYEVDQNVDKLLCYLLAFDNEEVYSCILKLLRWRIEAITELSIGTDFVWNIIFTLIATNNKTHQTNAYILWLRYLNNRKSNFETDGFFQTVLAESQYFQLLQDGLISDLHEHRKLCLSIIKISILKVSSNIDSEIFTWSTDDSQKYKKEWERYVTVYEILAIDTSLHQAEAAASDIIQLISPTSVIHPSWGFRLLSTGFRAGHEAVRKFTLNLLLSIPADHLYLIKHALPILSGIFLPFMMISHHLTVIEDDCPFGSVVSNYIRDMLKNCHNDQDTADIANTILKVVSDAKEAFDPTKIFVLLGVLDGLKDKQVLNYDDAGVYLIRIFEANSEGQVFFKMLQSITLRLIFNFKSLKETQVLTFFEKFIKFNGAELINENLSILSQFLTSNGFNAESFDGQYHDDFITAIALYLKAVLQGKLDHFESTSVFANFIGTSLDLSEFQNAEFDLWFTRQLQALADRRQSPEVYEILSKSTLRYESDIKLDSLWNLIKEDVQLDDEQVLRSSVHKYKFFNNLLNSKNIKVISFHDLLEFKKIVFINSRKAVVQSKDFYKVTEDILGQFYRTIEIMTNYNIEIDIDLVLPEVSSNLANNQSNVSIGKFLHYFLNQNISAEQVTAILKLLLEIWDNLISTRLQLNQKELHLVMIRAIASPKVLSSAVTDEEIAFSLSQFFNSVVENAAGRRSLLPALTRCLSDFQIHYTATFEKSYWLAEGLVKAQTMYQLRSNAFALETVIADMFDQLFGKDSHLYIEVYGEPEITSQINLMAIFNSVKTDKFALKLLDFIIDNQKSFNFYSVIKSTDGLEQWIRVRIVSLIISIIYKISNKDAEEYFGIFKKLLATDPSPLVRVYLEWIIATKINYFPEMVEDLFKGLKQQIHSTDIKPVLVCSYERLLILHINQLPKAEQEKSLERLLSIVISASTSNKANVRHFSTSLVCKVYPTIEQKKLDITPSTIDIMEKIYTTAATNFDLNEHRSGDALLWDAKEDLTLVNISGVILMRASDHEVDYITEKEYNYYLTKDQISHLNISVGVDHKELWLTNRKRTLNKTAITVNKPDSSNNTPLQTKSGAWSSVMDLDDSKSREVKRSDLIVVSSLVDKPPNLGGICRLCDVLGAGLLTLHDINVKIHPEFRNVAVTADQWMPMTEVRVEDIIPFLREKKKEGYTLIGLEQTDNSVELNNDLKFPKKSLILIGKEREGVPGELLAELDLCVEIKQVGVIRSMNIQTATAIIVHAYSSQHC